MDKETKLKLMMYWIFGTFVIIWASATIYIGRVIGVGTAIFSQLGYWLAVIISALLSVASFYGYKLYLNRK